MKIKTLAASDIILINEDICNLHGNRHQCYGIGKVESALHTSFYPGTPPYQHGGIAKVAGAMAFYLTKAHAFFDGNKRTAALASSIFMDMNGLNLTYPLSPNSFYKIIEDCAASIIGKEKVMEWFESHKVSID